MTSRAVLVSVLCLAPVSRAQEIPTALRPLAQASQQRLATAQEQLAQQRRQRDDLLAKQKTVAARINALPGATDEKLRTLSGQLSAAQTQLRTLVAALKLAKPAEFTTLAQMLDYDRQIDERDELEEAVRRLQREHWTQKRQLARGIAGGAPLCDQWQKLEEQIIAASHENTLAQLRRDSVARSEGNYQRQLKLRADAPLPETATRVTAAPPPDAAARRAAFVQRNSAAEVRKLGEAFFSQMTLTGPGLENVRALVAAQNYGAALEAYKRYFFAKLAKSETNPTNDEADEEAEGGANPNAAFSPPTATEIALALQNTVAQKSTTKGDARHLVVPLGDSGAMNWAFAESAPQDEALLALCRAQNYPGATGEALLHSYVLGGPPEHLQRWCEILDDWTLNWQRDADRCPVSLRDYNLLYVYRIPETLGRLRVMAAIRPSLAEDFPATTLARLLMRLHEEYLSSAIRLGRSGLYNFRIMALNGMIPTALQWPEFHAQQWALREGWRQVEDNFIYKIRRDGSNFEFANDGHENTDQSLWNTFLQLKNAMPQPPWAEPLWDEEFSESLLSNTRYWVHNLKPDGYSYRLNARTQHARYIGASPEYKVNLLMHEDETRRRLWTVFGIGKPEEAPRVNSESMAFQGYYYLRDGWQKDDYFLYLQSIGQPILSGREDNTGFSLYGKNSIFLLSPAPAVDGKTQNVHYGLVENPGGKSPFASYGKPDTVKTGRFHSDAFFDVAEARFDGVYQFHRPSDFFDSFGSYGYETSLAKAQSQAAKSGKAFENEPIKDVRQTRQIMALRGRETYIVTDFFESTAPHRFTQNYTVYTPVRADNLLKRLQLLRDAKNAPFVVDSAARKLATNNPGLANVQLRHITALPLQYTVSDDKRVDEIAAGADPKTVLKKFNKRDRQHGEQWQTVNFSRQVAVNWQGRGPQVLITLVTPQGRGYQSAPRATLHDLQSVTTQPGSAAFSAKLSDGTPLFYSAAAQPQKLTIGPLQGTATALLLCGTRGVALDCTALGELKPPVADFTFRLENDRAVFEAPIYRPIAPVKIAAPAVFIDQTTVELSCATPGVQLRYTLDGTHPTPQSPLYNGPFVINQTCRLKVRAFRREVHSDIWQQDGTHATVVYAALLRRETPQPAVAVPAAVSALPGLRYEYFEGAWTTLMARSQTMPAKTRGVTNTLLDVTPRQSNGSFGIRYAGFLEVPQDGVYTFHAPDEFIYPDKESGYDLRVFVNDREWYPAVRWQHHGTWSVALRKGKHRFAVSFVDLRPKPHKIELMWGFPHPDFTWNGTAPQLHFSGPGLPKGPLGGAMFSHTP